MKTALILLSLMIAPTHSFAQTQDPTCTPTPTPAMYSDSQIVAIAQAFNAAQLNIAMFVRPNVVTEPVINYLGRVGDDFAAVNAELEVLIATAGIIPEASDTSRAIEEAARVEMEAYACLSGVELEKAYVAAQIAKLDAMIVAFDQRLILEAQHVELKSHVQKVRNVSAETVERAKAIQWTEERIQKMFQ